MAELIQFVLIVYAIAFAVKIAVAVTGASVILIHGAICATVNAFTSRSTK